MFNSKNLVLMTKGEFVASKKLTQMATDWLRHQLNCESNKEVKDILVAALNGIIILDYHESNLEVNETNIKALMQNMSVDSLEMLEAYVKYAYKEIVIYKFVNHVKDNNNK